MSMPRSKFTLNRKPEPVFIQATLFPLPTPLERMDVSIPPIWWWLLIYLLLFWNTDSFWNTDDTDLTVLHCFINEFVNYQKRDTPFNIQK